MKVPLSLIKQLTTVALNTEELVQKIKSQIGEVEEYHNPADSYRGILVGQITKAERHPDAEKLGVYQVNIGNETVQVVAGDVTLEEGDLVAYFTPGSKLPGKSETVEDGGEIKRTKLRGIESNGMLASEKELKLSNRSEYVMKLPKNNGEFDLFAGMTFTEAYMLEDIVIDVENKALANRPDAFGLIGIAREIAGITDVAFKTPEWYVEQDIEKWMRESELPVAETAEKIEVINETETLCKRFTAAVVKDVTVKPSPVWLQSALLKLGTKTINNIVDISNYLMLLTGQPIHIYDYDKIMAKDPIAQKNGYVTIKVRTAMQGEKITTLDEKTRELDDKAVVVTDNSNPISIFGIMGGYDTEVGDDTKNVVVEVANADMYNIRKTSMRLGVFTDAVTRFTKGQDTLQIRPVMLETLKMLAQLAGGRLNSEIADQYTLPKEQKSVTFSISKLNNHLGLELSKEEITKILSNVELFPEAVVDDEDLMIIQVPAWRNDINIRQDIHEEVGRLYGYVNIPIKLPNRDIHPVEKLPIYRIKEKVRSILTGSGANEILSYNFVGEALYKAANLPIQNAFKLINPLSPELEYMRTTLIPSILEKVPQNINSGHSEFALYEINKTHSKLDMDIDRLPIERDNLGFVFVADNKVAKSRYEGSPYYQAKLYLDQILGQVLTGEIIYLSPDEAESHLGAALPNWITEERGLYNLGACAVVALETNGIKTAIGIIGEIKSSVITNLKLPAYSAAFEINLGELAAFIDMPKRYAEPSRYPKVSRDLCFVVEAGESYGRIISAMNSVLAANKELRYETKPVDIYQSEKQAELKEPQKQVTVNLTIASERETLTSKQVEELYGSVIKAVGDETGGKLV